MTLGFIKKYTPLCMKQIKELVGILTGTDRNPVSLQNINLKYKFALINKDTWGNIYNPLQTSLPLLHIDPVDLKNSPDYTLLYGVKVEECLVRIHYNDNRRKGRSWDIELKNNMFIMFPSTNMYYITNNQKKSLNFIQTITYEFI